jgi:hypothetical protein
MGLRKAILKQPLVRSVTFGTMILCLPPGAVACGYHDDVSLARGVLNWVYPDALHVVGAMAQAVAEKRLPARATARDLFGYHRVVRSLQEYGKKLQMPSAEMQPSAFSLLLIEPMLWARFMPEGSGFRTQVHTSGPQAGDLVVISGEEVVRGVANNSWTVGQAYRSGVMRLYGTDEQVRFFLALHDHAGRRRPTQ